MNSNQEQSIQFQYQSNQHDFLFSEHSPSSNSYQLNQMPLMRQQQFEQTMDEQLLKKTSELHEALRNKKLLQFQLLQAKIMKQHNFSKASQIIDELATIKQTSEIISTNIEQIQSQIVNVEGQIKQNTIINKFNEKKMDQLIIMIKTKEKQLALFSNQENNRTLNRAAKHQLQYKSEYIEIQKIRLAYANNTHDIFIRELKQQIKKYKQYLAQKQNQAAQLQKQYQQLLLQYQEQQKLAQRQALKSQNVIKQKSMKSQYIQNTQIIQKQNNINALNTIDYKNQFKQHKKNSIKGLQESRKKSNTKNKIINQSKHYSTSKKYKKCL